MLNRESLWFLISPFGSDSNKKKPQKCGFFRYNQPPARLIPGGPGIYPMRTRTSFSSRSSCSGMKSPASS